jgi:hypothetical protein
MSIKPASADPLDAARGALAAGDFATARRLAASVAADANANEEARTAARALVERTTVDPRARTLYLLAAALLIVLGGYWTFRSSKRPEVPVQRTEVEFVK